jgi:hypothetical protein
MERNTTYSDVKLMWRSGTYRLGLTVCLMCTMAAFMSCSPQSAPSPPQQSPLQSSTPASNVSNNRQERNFLGNGSFEEWFSGSNSPSGFEGPSGKYSKIERETKEAVDGSIAIRQTWSESDVSDSFWFQFHSLPLTLTPRTYRLTVKARNLSKNSVGIAASVVDYSAPASSPGIYPVEVLGNVILIPPDGQFREYSGSLLIKGSDSKVVMFSVYSTGKPETYPATILWDDWRLTSDEN